MIGILKVLNKNIRNFKFQLKTDYFAKMFHIIVLLMLLTVPTESVNMLEYSEEDIDEFPIDIIPTIYWHPANPL